MARWQFTKGLHDIGNGHYAYLLPDGSWGWSNAGLITDSEYTLLVDTLFDLKLTGEMLESMRAAVPAAREIGTLVNTHANGDHYFGNQLVTGAEIIASEACLRDMLLPPPEKFFEMLRTWRSSGRPGGQFMQEMMGSRFDFSGIVFTPPTRTFESNLTLHVGSKRVELVKVGPAHTSGDILVYIPEDRVVYTGDILFVGGHAPAWAGPVANWIKACDLMLSWDPEVVVPGHGPITDKSGIRRMKRYFEYLSDEVRRCFDAGLDVAEAARSISLAEFEDWSEPERIVVNIDTLYREFAGREGWGNRADLNDLMAQYYHEHRHAEGHHS